MKMHRCNPSSSYAQTVEMVNLICDKLKAALEEKTLAGVEAADKKAKKEIQDGIDQRIPQMNLAERWRARGARQAG
ncbi:MAG: hypothetical protein U0Y68_02805 [Blastocatellia bacterium]